jgi:hypothetical protein
MDKLKILTYIKHAVIVSIVLLFSSSTKPESKEKDFILWNNNKSLEWKDFQAKASIVPGASALTVSAIQSSYNCNGNGPLQYTIKAVFMPDKSWVKKSDKTDYLLYHEQVHFDITEIHARLFRKELSERKLKCNQRGEFEKISNKINKAWLSYQELYDKETRHSINEEAQKEWNKKIAKELSDLRGFAL